MKPDGATIEWTKDGYPTHESLFNLEGVFRLKGCKEAINAFYAALRENRYPEFCGPEKVEVRGKVIDVWAYHTAGWSGNEEIISVLKDSGYFNWFLERYDAGGHYYFKMPMNEINGGAKDEA